MTGRFHRAGGAGRYTQMILDTMPATKEQL